MLFDQENTLSLKFQRSFAAGQYGRSVKISEVSSSLFPGSFKSLDCIFIALNFSTAEKYLVGLLDAQWAGLVVGIGDWNIFSMELKAVLDRHKNRTVRVAVPTGWVPEMNRRSSNFDIRVKEQIGRSESPIAAYTYDAVLLALDSICKGSDFLSVDLSVLRRLPLLRNYEGISPGGNYLSQIRIIHPK